MPQRSLPDFSDPVPLTSKCPSIQVSEEHSGYDQWRQNPSLAPWVLEWLKELQEIYGSTLATAIFKGLGRHWHVPAWMRMDRPDPRWLRRFLRSGLSSREWFDSGYCCDDPQWLERLLHSEAAQVARSFLISGNTSDYAFDPVHGYRPAINILLDHLGRTKDCVLHFRLSKGLSVHKCSDSSNIDRFSRPMRELIKARIPRKDASFESEIRTMFVTLNQWLTGCNDAGPSEPDASEFQRGVALVIENVNLIIPPDLASLERNFLIDVLLHWSGSPEMFRQKHCLVLTVESLEHVSAELQGRGGKIEQICIRRPGSFEERHKFILPLLDPSSEMLETRAANLHQGLRLEGFSGNYRQQLRQLAYETAGLTFLGIEDLLQQAADRGQCLNRQSVMALKCDRLRQDSHGLLEIVQPTTTLDSIGGYPEIKKRLREVIDALQNSADERIRSTVPMGILLMGPPGTGKSLVAEAFAGESKISMAKLGNIRGMYVGQSESNIASVFSLIESLYPVIVFVDEIDQAIGQRGGPSGDSGVDNRLFGKILEFMSDKKHRGRILWIAASNLPNKIDSAMKRPGRFDLLLPFGLPDPSSRSEILRLSLEKAAKCPEGAGPEAQAHDLTEENFDEIARFTEGLSPADLCGIVEKVNQRCLQREIKEGQFKPITLKDVLQVLAVYRAPEGQLAHNLEMQKLAFDEIPFLDLLPSAHHTCKGSINTTTETKL